MDSRGVEMFDQWGALYAPPMSIGGLWLAKELWIARRSKTFLFFLSLSLCLLLMHLWPKGVGGDVISVMDSSDCAVKGRSLSSVAYQKSVLAFAGSRHAIIYVGCINDYL